MDQCQPTLPKVIAGPILRRVTPQQLVLWMVTSEPFDIKLTLGISGQPPYFDGWLDHQCQSIRIGERAYIQLIDVSFPDPLEQGETIHYQLHLRDNQQTHSLTELCCDLLYSSQTDLNFELQPRLGRVLHGSCRKPHYPSGDGLIRVDEQLEKAQAGELERPALLLMTGDQIYADDVAGPFLVAVHQTIALLGLYDETLSGALVKDSQELFKSPYCYYLREELLPRSQANQALRDRFFAGARKPIFTTNSAHNHLITLSETLATYCLVWSPALWPLLDLNPPVALPQKYAKQYAEERKEVERFATGLNRVRRALAHLPVYMIFDDHDITDDWNLTRNWEETAYNHPFSKRIIGNALIGYYLCQGWGNDPAAFDHKLMGVVCDYFNNRSVQTQDQLIDQLLIWQNWHYSVPTQPKLLVLDTRTHRWRSESSGGKPSGLMDWEALSALQQELMHEPSVILVSPAPIFGVKLIEIIQRILSYLGLALIVDAENWMAHPGSANVLLNIFLHSRTPQQFIILSGDVHYSFAYDVSIRHRIQSPHIWQITASGLKNEFPRALLCVFEWFNRWLYASRSPLNWFTKRSKMRLKARRYHEGPQRLLNRSGLGLIELDENFSVRKVSLLPWDGDEHEFR